MWGGKKKKPLKIEFKYVQVVVTKLKIVVTLFVQATITFR